MTVASASTPLPSRSSIMNSKPPVWLRPADRRRLEHQTPRRRGPRSEICCLELARQAVGSQLGLVALRPLLEDDERRGRVGLVGRVEDVEAFEHEHVADRLQLLRDLADRLGDPATWPPAPVPSGVWIDAIR